jgi:hypothetical protein
MQPVESRYDVFNGHMAGNFTGFVPAHSIAHDEDVTELFCLVTFAEAVVVFVVLAMSPHIGAGRVATLH